jgi:hypothetical protein
MKESEFGWPGVGVVVGDAEEVEGIDVDLSPGGVVTGRVVDDDGKPVVNTRVVVESHESSNNPPVRSFNILGSNWSTDDRGIYRIYGVTPGRYLVWAGEAPNSGGVSLGRGASYPQTYYPGVSEKHLARPVEIKEGGEATGIDFALARKKKTYAARGRVLDDNDKPVANLALGYGPLRTEGGFFGGFGSMGTRSDNDGNFVVGGLPPDKYGLFGFFESDSGLFSDVAQFEITDSDVAGLEIRVHRGSSVSGSVIVEGSDVADPGTKLASLMLFVSTMSKGSDVAAPSGRQVKIGADGSFVANGLRAGKLRISLPPYPFQKEFSLNRVEIDGVSSSEGIEVQTGQNLVGVRVVVSHGSFTMTGQINVEGGEIPAEARFFVAARRAGADASMRIQVYADSRRRFRIEGLSSGEYEIEVRGFVVSDAMRPISAKKSVTVSGDLSDVVITVDVAPKKDGQQ